MQLDAYFRSPDSLPYTEVARRISCPDPAQVRQWAHKYAGRRPGLKYACALERELYPHVTCEELLADVPWFRIPDPSWPNPKGRPVIDPLQPQQRKKTKKVAPQSAGTSLRV